MMIIDRIYKRLEGIFNDFSSKEPYGRTAGFFTKVEIVEKGDLAVEITDDNGVDLIHRSEERRAIP